MKKTLTKILSVVLALVLTLSLRSLCFASSDEFGYDFSYFNQTLILVNSFFGTPDENGTVIVPDTIDGYKVVGVDARTFEGNTDVKTLVIPVGCEVDADAFLDSEIVPAIIEKPDYNGGYLVDGSKEFVMNGTTLVMYNGKSSNVTIPSNCTAIGSRAFVKNKKIVSVKLPKNLSSIGAEAFLNCEKLSTVSTDNKDASISVGTDAFKNTAYIKDETDHLKLIGATLVKYTGDQKILYLPTFIKSLGAMCFEGSDTTDVIIPEKCVKFAKNFAEKGMVNDTTVYVKPYVCFNSAADKACYSMNIEYDYAGVPGDANSDGNVTAVDARILLRISAKLEKPLNEIMTLICDLDHDKKITATDARQSLRIAAKLVGYGDREKNKLPVTSLGVMEIIGDATELVREYGPQYSYYAYQDITEEKCNKATIKNVMKSGLVSKSKAQTYTFKAKSADALTKMISFNNVDIDSVGAFNFKNTGDELVMSMTLYGEKYSMGDVRVPKCCVFCPAFETTQSLTERITDNNALKNVKLYVTYSSATITVKIDAETKEMTSLETSVNYDFDISGKSGGSTVRDSLFGSKNASIKRTDKILYNNFDWSKV